MLSRLVMGTVVYGNAAMMYAIHLITKYIGIAAYAAVASIITIIIGVPVILLETALYGGDIVTGFFGTGIWFGLMAYFISYNTSPTADSALFGGPRECLAMVKELTGQAQRNPVNAAVSGIKMGYKKSNETNNVFAGLGTVVNSTSALVNTLIQSIKSQSFIVDPRIVRNVWYFNITLSPSDAGAKTINLDDSDPAMRQLGIEHLLASACEHGTKPVFNHSKQSPEEVSKRVVALLNDDNSDTRLLAAQLLQLVSDEYPMAVGAHTNDLRSYLDQSPPDRSHLHVIEAISNVVNRTPESINNPATLVEIFGKVAQTEATRPFGIKGLAFLSATSFSSIVSDYDNLFIEYIEDMITTTEFKLDYEAYIADEPPKESESESWVVCQTIFDAACGLALVAKEVPDNVEQHLDTLELLATHESPALRRLACEVLSAIPDSREKKMITELTDDPDQRVANFAQVLINPPDKVIENEFQSDNNYLLFRYNNQKYTQQRTDTSNTY